MSSTNKTTHYDLPQWIGTDKPTFLGDLNGAFSTIDTQLYTAVTNAENANNNASSAAGAVSNMQNDVNNLKTWQTTASSAISGLQNSVTNLTPNIGQTNTLVTGLGTFLQGSNPVINANNSSERLITIGSLKLLNIFGSMDITYDGTPNASQINETMNGLVLQNLFSKYSINTGRSFYMIGNCYAYTSNGNQIFPIRLGSDGTNTKLYSAVAGGGTLNSGSHLYFDFQALLCIN